VRSLHETLYSLEIHLPDTLNVQQGVLQAQKFVFASHCDCVVCELSRVVVVLFWQETWGRNVGVRGATASYH
jgi:hypothetical protein